MPSNTIAHDESDDRTAHRTATDGSHTLGQRLTAKGTRLFRSREQDTNNDETELPWRTRQHALRDYHAGNLATARTGSEERVRAGFNTGDVPDGYRALRIRVTPTGRRPRWRTQVLIEPVEASTVRRIFTRRAEDRLSASEIRRRLAASRYSAPLDPDSGQPSMRTVTDVQTILRYLKYLGCQVWGRTHHGQRVPRSEWVWSGVWAHPPVVTPTEFTAAHPRFRYPHSTSAVDAA